jgi:hypothetical protein
VWDSTPLVIYKKDQTLRRRLHHASGLLNALPFPFSHIESRKLYPSVAGLSSKITYFDHLSQDHSFTPLLLHLGRRLVVLAPHHHVLDLDAQASEHIYQRCSSHRTNCHCSTIALWKPHLEDQTASALRSKSSAIILPESEHFNVPALRGSTIPSATDFQRTSPFKNGPCFGNLTHTG